MLMPCLLFQAKDRCNLTIIGGTYVGMSPTIAALEHVLYPALKMFGLDVSLKVVKNGFFPDVVGEVCLSIPSLKAPLKPISFMSRGSSLLSIEVYIMTTLGKG